MRLPVWLWCPCGGDLWVPQFWEGYQAVGLNVPPVAEAFWGAEDLLHQCAAQHAGSTAVQDVLASGKCSWRVLSAAAPLEIFTKLKGFNQRQAVHMWQPWVHLHIPALSGILAKPSHPIILISFLLALINMESPTWVSWEACVCFLTHGFIFTFIWKAD